MSNEKLKRARRVKGWTQEETAKRAHVSRITYTRLESGSQQPHPTTIEHLCKAFDMSPEELGFPSHKRPKQKNQFSR